MQQTKPEEKYSFDEFKMYYETTERVTKRRLRNNEMNLSLCTAIIIALGLAWSWALSNLIYSPLIFCITLLVSIIASIFSALWLQQILDFKLLNKAKFSVLEKMASNLAFEHNSDITIVSYQPFKEEWVNYNAMTGTKEGRKKIRLDALKSTDLELFLPRAFQIVFVITAIISFIGILSQYNSLLHEINALVSQISL